MSLGRAKKRSPFRLIDTVRSPDASQHIHTSLSGVDAPCNAALVRIRRGFSAVRCSHRFPLAVAFALLIASSISWRYCSFTLAMFPSLLCSRRKDRMNDCPHLACAAGAAQAGRASGRGYALKPSRDHVSRQSKNFLFKDANEAKRFP